MAGPAVLPRRRGEDSRTPIVASLNSGLVVACPSFATTGAVWSMTWRSSSTVVDVPVTLVVLLTRALCTGTRPGLTPAIRAGKGWRGRQELAPRRSATQISRMRYVAWTDTSPIHKVRSTTTTSLLGYWEAVCRHGRCGPISSLRPWDNWILPGFPRFL